MSVISQFLEDQKSIMLLYTLPESDCKPFCSKSFGRSLIRRRQLRNHLRGAAPLSVACIVDEFTTIELTADVHRRQSLIRAR